MATGSYVGQRESEYEYGIQWHDIWAKHDLEPEHHRCARSTGTGLKTEGLWVSQKQSLCYHGDGNRLEPHLVAISLALCKERKKEIYGEERGGQIFSAMQSRKKAESSYTWKRSKILIQLWTQVEGSFLVAMLVQDNGLWFTPFWTKSCLRPQWRAASIGWRHLFKGLHQDFLLPWSQLLHCDYCYYWLSLVSFCKTWVLGCSLAH